MPDTRAEKLMALAGRFELDGDLMRCRACGRGIHISRDREDMIHAYGCRNETYERPWELLAGAISQEGTNG